MQLNNDKQATSEQGQPGQAGPATSCQNSAHSPCGQECAFGIDCAADRATRGDPESADTGQQVSGQTDGQGGNDDLCTCRFSMPPKLTGNLDQDDVIIAAYDAYTRRLVLLDGVMSRWADKAIWGALAVLGGITLLVHALH